MNHCQMTTAVFVFRRNKPEKSSREMRRPRGFVANVSGDLRSAPTPMMHCVCFSYSLERLGPGGVGGGAVIFWAVLSPKPEGPRPYSWGWLRADLRLSTIPSRGRCDWHRGQLGVSKVTEITMWWGRGHAVYGSLSAGHL